MVIMSRSAIVVSDANDSNALCRLCMMYHEYYANIFIPSDTFRICVEEAIHDLLRLKVTEGDGLPSAICHQCLRKLITFRDFKEMCLKSDIELRKSDLGNFLTGFKLKVEEAADLETSRDKSIQENTFQNDIQVTEVYVTVPDELAMENMCHVKGELVSTENVSLEKGEINCGVHCSEGDMPLTTLSHFAMDPLAVDTTFDIKVEDGMKIEDCSPNIEVRNGESLEENEGLGEECSGGDALLSETAPENQANLQDDCSPLLNIEVCIDEGLVRNGCQAKAVSGFDCKAGSARGQVNVFDGVFHCQVEGEGMFMELKGEGGRSSVNVENESRVPNEACDPLASDNRVETDNREVYPKDPLGGYDGFVEEDMAETEGNEVAALCGEIKQFAVVEPVDRCDYVRGTPEVRDVYFDKNGSSGLEISNSQLLNNSSFNCMPEGKLQLEYSMALSSGAHWDPEKIVKKKKTIPPFDSNEMSSQLNDRVTSVTNNKCKQLCHHIAKKCSPAEYICDYCSKRYSEIHSLALHIKGHVDRNVSEIVLPEKEFPGGNSSNPLVRNGRNVDTIILAMSKQSVTQTKSKNKCEKLSFNEFAECENFGREIKHIKALLSDTVTPWDKVGFVCDACGISFQKKSDLVNHVNIHVGLSTLKCRFCEKIYTLNSRLKKHEAIHTEVKRFKCDFHGNEFSKKHDMANTVLKRFNCDICGKNFKCSGQLKRHTVVHTGEKPFKCKICGKMFTQSGNLKKHLSIHAGVKPHKCDVCGKMFSLKGNLETHLRIHTGVRPFKCHLCENSFTYKSSLREHLLIHTGEKPFKCKFCGKMFTQSGNLKSHLSIHAGVKPHKCDVCGKMFTQKCNLETHMRIHTGVKPFKCHLCGRNFKTKGTLKVHSRIHTGIKPYKCAVCGKMFTQISGLNAHSVAHTGFKPFKCNVSGRMFTQSCSLKNHLLNHAGEKPFKCEKFGNKFTEKGGLKENLVNHTGVKP